MDDLRQSQILDADWDVVVDEDDDSDPLSTTNNDGVVEIELPDGSVVIDLHPLAPRGNEQSKGHDENLAEKIDSAELARIAGDLYQGIDSDDRSRSQWLEARARGIDLLGLKLDDPKSDIAAGAPLEGMSTVRDPILLEACIRFMANASAELLPAAGPVKVRNDGPGTAGMDSLAETLQKDMNTYLTTTAADYYPDTKRMLFMTGFGGSGFKKVYHSPLKNRPVSEYVDAKDLIVSNAAVDLSSASRVTQVVRMKNSDMVRMQLLGVYRDVDMFQQPMGSPDAVQNKINTIQGIQPQTQSRPEDQDYELWECYCELDVRGHEHKKDGKPTGLALPYRVTIDKNTQEILEIRRNWDEDDPEYLPKKTFVEFSYIKAFGFYGIGLLHILGNIAVALTAGTREVLDAGMLANFPGFLYLQTAGTRQMTNHFRIPPGGGAPLQANGQMAIKDMVMPLPYKQPGAEFMTFLGAVRENGQRVGNMAEVAVGEGTANAPVGTTLALIEQQTKVEGAVHKGLYTSQSEELRMLKKCFQEDPEALWRHAKKTEGKWNAEKLIAALEEHDLQPQADPNTPSHMQRLMKALGIKQLVAGNPQMYDAKKVDMRVADMMGIDDIESLMLPPAPPQQPIPPPQVQVAMINAQAKQAQIAADSQNKDKALQAQVAIAQMKQPGQQPDPSQPEQPAVDPKLQVAMIQAQTRAADREAAAVEKERDRDTKLMVEKLKLVGNLVVHPENEDMAQYLLNTEQIPLYEEN